MMSGRDRAARAVEFVGMRGDEAADDRGNARVELKRRDLSDRDARGTRQPRAKCRQHLVKQPGPGRYGHQADRLSDPHDDEYPVHACEERLPRRDRQCGTQGEPGERSCAPLHPPFVQAAQQSRVVSGDPELLGNGAVSDRGSVTDERHPDGTVTGHRPASGVTRYRNVFQPAHAGDHEPVGHGSDQHVRDPFCRDRAHLTRRPREGFTAQQDGTPSGPRQGTVPRRRRSPSRAAARCGSPEPRCLSIPRRARMCAANPSH